MSKLLRGIAAGYGAKKMGGGCFSTVIIFILLWWLLGHFGIFKERSSVAALIGARPLRCRASWRRRSEFPAERRKGHATGRIDSDAFALQTKTLCDARARSVLLETQLALRIDDAMPRHRGPSRKCAQRIAREPSLSREPGKARYCAVRRHATLRNLSNDREDSFVRSEFFHDAVDVT